MSKKLYPFDLEKALAGAPVCTKLTRTPVRIIGRFSELEGSCKVVGIRAGNLEEWTDLGGYNPSRPLDVALDLFMCDQPPRSPEMQLVKELAEYEGSGLSDKLNKFFDFQSRAKAITSAV